MAVLLFLTLGLELAWRFQWIDTYRRELNVLNPTLEVQKSGKTILLMGDSFTAAQNSWAETLRKLRPNDKIINSAVPGTSVLHANVMLSGRLETFQPDLLIYQIYVGNDLFDLRYPLNWQELSFGRYFYWALANRFRGIGWLNYALGQFNFEDEISPLAYAKLKKEERKRARPKNSNELNDNGDLGW